MECTHGVKKEGHRRSGGGATGFEKKNHSFYMKASYFVSTILSWSKYALDHVF